MVSYIYVHKNDYDKKIKLGDTEVLCYSKAKLDGLYPKGEFHIIGETKRFDNEKKHQDEILKKKRDGKYLGALSVNERHLHTFVYGTYSKYLHKEQGYACVGGNNYVVLKESRVPFIILLSSMLAAIAVCTVLMVLMLENGSAGQHGTEHPLPDVDPNIEKIESTTGGMGEDIDPSITSGKDDVEQDGPEDTKSDDTDDTEPSDIYPDDTEPGDPDESETESTTGTETTDKESETTDKESETTGKEPETTDKESETTGKEPETTEKTPDTTESYEPEYPAVTTKPTITPDETLPPDTTAPAPDENKDGGSVSMIYTLSASVSLKNGKTGIFFQNPTKSTHNVMIELYVVSGGNEYLIGKSRLIPPGYQLSTLDYSDSQVTLVKGIYQGLYKVLFYDGTTGEKANVNSNIPNVKITVKD